MASSYFSSRTDGTLRVASIGCNPFNHLVLRNVELITPEGDTVCTAHTVALRFNKFPYHKHGLSFSRVRLKDTYYHLAIDSAGINLRYIIDSFNKDRKHTKEAVEFVVLADNLILDNVSYRQDLKDSRTREERSAKPGVGVKHMHWRHINARIRNLRVDKDFVTCRIDRFSAQERSGLQVKELTMNVYSSHNGISATNLALQTEDSYLQGDVLLDFHSWKSMKDFTDSVYLSVHFEEGSYAGMQDAAYWAHSLWGMDERVSVSGSFAGPISDFHADDVRLAFGDETHLDLDAHLTGLPNIDSTIIDARINNLHTVYSDLASVKHPRNITMKAESIMKKLDVIDLDATFCGKISDFRAFIDANTSQGPVIAQVNLAMNPKSKNYRYSGEIKSDAFSIIQIAPNEWVSRSGFDCTFQGSGFDPKTMNATAQGRLNHTVVKGQRLLGETAFDISAKNGNIAAEINIDDALAAVNANGSIEWRSTGPLYTAELDVDHVDLQKFGLWKDSADNEAILSAHLSGRYSLNDNGNSTARITAENVSFNTTTRNAHLNNATLMASDRNHWKNVSLRSDIIDARMQGYYELADIAPIVKKFRYDFFPSGETGMPPVDEYLWQTETETVGLVDARFELNAEINDTTGLLRFFVPQLYLAPGTTVQANYSAAESFKPILRSDSVAWGPLKAYNLGANGESAADLYRVRLTSDELMIGDVLLSENTDIRVESSKHNALCRFYWENSSKTVGGGDVNFRLVDDNDRISLIVDPSVLALGEQQWTLQEVNTRGSQPASSGIYLNKQGFHIGGLALSSGEQKLLLHASRLGNPSDSIEVLMQNFSLAVANPLLNTVGMTVDGIAHGNVRIGFIKSSVNTLTHSSKDIPYLNGDLSVDNLAFDGENLGNARVRSTWNAEQRELNLQVNSLRDDGSQPLQLVGYLTLDRDDPELNFSVSLDDVGMKTLNPFLQDFASDISGSIFAEADINGTLSKPVVEGFLFFDSAAMTVDFLNVRYSFADTVFLEEKAIRLDNFIISDPQGNQAQANGIIHHSHLKDMAVDLSLESDNFLCMNTSAKQSENYFGSVFASLYGIVSGPADDLDIVIDASTKPGTVLVVPINDKRQLKQADYIHFVSEFDEPHQTLQLSGSPTPQPLNPATPQSTNSDKNNFLLTINVETTPDLRMVLPIDFSSVTVDIDATGDGDLQLQFGTDKDFSLKGDYELVDGTLDLDILGVLSKEFTIDEGSSITFPGKISDALFDIKAVYSQRVNMSSLTGSLSATESQKQVQVENVIALSGTLQSPDINFDLRLPNADQSVQEEVFAYIDRNNERDMLNQTVSLLLFKKFYNASVTTTASTASPTEEGYGLVVGTLGSMVSDMVQFVDINFNYQAGNALTTEQYAVDISKEWNKFYFETTLGFGGDAREMNEAGGNNNMTGDMLVGYKINPRFHLFVFNRSNTNDYTRSDLPYKQGVGVKYTRDFDTLGELFRRKNKTK